MDEQVSWVTKAEAVRELEMSQSTLDRKISRGIRGSQEGTPGLRAAEGARYVTDKELLCRSFVREGKIHRTVLELDRRASELERERDQGREAASACGSAYEEMEQAYQKERAAHEDKKGRLNSARVIALVLQAMMIGGVLVWWFVLRQGDNTFWQQNSDKEERCMNHRLIDLIVRAPWREAVTYRDTWPHEYVLTEKDNQRELLDAICTRFRAGEGVACRFFRMNNTYLFVGDYKYWLMTDYNDIDPYNDEGDYVINRARLYRDRRDFVIQPGDTGKPEDYPINPPSQSSS